MQENRKIITLKIIALILVLIAFLVLLIGISFVAGGRYVTHNIQILYISQAELLNIEKARIASGSVLDKELFFGKPKKAIRYVEQIQNQMSKNGILILLTDSKIYGSNIRSISKETHSQIINKLSSEIENNNR